MQMMKANKIQAAVLVAVVAVGPCSARSISDMLLSWRSRPEQVRFINCPDRTLPQTLARTAEFADGVAPRRRRPTIS